MIENGKESSFRISISMNPIKFRLAGTPEYLDNHWEIVFCNFDEIRGHHPLAGMFEDTRRAKSHIPLVLLISKSSTGHIPHNEPLEAELQCAIGIRADARAVKKREDF
jgi:hypothetical protein